jgi:hypothetical protein
MTIQELIKPALINELVAITTECRNAWEKVNAQKALAPQPTTGLSDEDVRNIKAQAMRLGSTHREVLLTILSTALKDPRLSAFNDHGDPTPILETMEAAVYSVVVLGEDRTDHTYPLNTPLLVCHARKGNLLDPEGSFETTVNGELPKSIRFATDGEIHTMVEQFTPAQWSTILRSDTFVPLVNEVLNAHLPAMASA